MTVVHVPKAILVCAALAAGCGTSAGDDPIADAAKAWAAAKGGCTTYSYARMQQTVGQPYFTSVEVTADVATRRHFSGTSATPPYDEQGAEVGTHTDGATAETVEQLLDECVAQRPAPTSFMCPNEKVCSFTFEANPLGVPTRCQAFRRGAAYDYTPGIVLGGFACAPLAADGSVGP